MAYPDDELRNQRPNSFGDGAAAARDSNVTQVQGAGPLSRAARSVPPNAIPAAPVLNNADSTGGRPNSFGDATAAASNPGAGLGFSGLQANSVSQIPAGGYPRAPQADGSQNNPLNSEFGRNTLNTLSALPGVQGLGIGAGTARAATTAGNTAGNALSTERVLPAAWELVQDAGPLATRAAGSMSTPGFGFPTAAREALAGPAGQLARTASGFTPPPLTELAGQAGNALSTQAGGFGRMAQQAATPLAELASSQVVPGAAQAMAAGGRGFGLPAAAVLGGAGLAATAMLGSDSGPRGFMNEAQAAQTPPASPLSTMAAQPAPQAPRQNDVTRDGNSYSAAGPVSGDFTINGLAPRNGGMISAQNMGAAEALSRSQQAESLARVQAQGLAARGGYPGSGPVEPGSFTGGFSGIVGGGSGNMMSRTPEQQRRDAEVQSTSILRPTADRGRTALAALDTRDLQGARNIGQLDVAQVNNQGAMDRAQLQEGGEFQRTGMREQGLNLRAVIEARKSGQAPAGYQWNGNGGLQAIAGGPADPSVRGSRAPLNDVQSKALQFGTRMQASGAVLDGLAAKGIDQPGMIKRMADAIGAGAAANWTQSPGQQQVEQGQRDFINAALRRESGAAIADSEFANARQQYFPQPGDSDQVTAQKKRNREIATTGILAEVPDSEKRVNQVLTQAGTAPTAATQPATPAGPAAAPAQQRTATRTGVMNGRKVTQYSDGSIDYAD